MGTISEEVLDLLSEEERAALEDDEDSGKDDDANKDNDGAGDDETKEEEEARLKAEEDVKAADEEAARLKAEQEAQAEEDAKAKGPEGEKETAIPAAIPTAIPPFQLKATGKTPEQIDEALKALDDQFEEGDITLKDYNARRDTLTREKWTAETYEDINKQVAIQTVENTWKQAQKDFFAANENFGTNAVLNAAFVHVVNGLLASEEGKKLTDAALLKKAKETVEESLGIGKKGEPTKDDDGKAALAAAKKKEAERGKDGKSIRDIPKDDSTEFGDKFDVLDRLDGEAFEKAIAKLSDAERREYGRRG